MMVCHWLVVGTGAAAAAARRKGQRESRGRVDESARKEGKRKEGRKEGALASAEGRIFILFSKGTTRKG